MRTYEISVPAKYPEFYSNANFNPSLIKTTIGDNLYLMSCHSFRRFTDPKLKGPLNDVNDPNHPWYGGPSSQHWWKIEKNEGFHGTGFFLVQYDGNRFNIIDYLGLIYMVVDARLFRLNSSQIFMTANAITPFFEIGLDRNKYGLAGGYVNCAQDKCSLITRYVLQIKVREKKITLFSSEARTLCNNLSRPTEKNWSAWEFNNMLNFSYSLTPQHYTLDVSDPTYVTGYWPIELTRSESGYTTLDTPIACDLNYSKSLNIFTHIEMVHKGAVVFSLSTPALPFTNDLYIGVGHVKIIGDHLNEAEDLPAVTFYHQNSSMIRHPAHNTFYLMYFYTFNPSTLDIVKVSYSFLPPNVEYGVVFPCGLTLFSSDTYLISYGEADMKMKILAITRN